VKRFFAEKQIGFFLNVDFIGHVALVAVLTEAAGTTVRLHGRAGGLAKGPESKQNGGEIGPLAAETWIFGEGCS
jgi:hypothetical protein